MEVETRERNVVVGSKKLIGLQQVFKEGNVVEFGNLVIVEYRDRRGRVKCRWGPWGWFQGGGCKGMKLNDGRKKAQP